jgi:hypothetical protein
MLLLPWKSSIWFYACIWHHLSCYPNICLALSIITIDTRCRWIIWTTPYCCIYMELAPCKIWIWSLFVFCASPEELWVNRCLSHTVIKPWLLPCFALSLINLQDNSKGQANILEGDIVDHTKWFKYDRDKLWLVYTQIVPVIFEPSCSKNTYLCKPVINSEQLERDRSLWIYKYKSVVSGNKQR